MADEKKAEDEGLGKFGSDYVSFGFIPLTYGDQKRIENEWELVAKRRKETGF